MAPDPHSTSSLFLRLSVALASACSGLLVVFLCLKWASVLVKQNHECLAFPFPQRSQSFFYQSREDYRAYQRRTVPGAVREEAWAKAAYNVTPWRPLIEEVHHAQEKEGGERSKVRLGFALLLCEGERENSVLDSIHSLLDSDVAQEDVHLFLACPSRLSTSFQPSVASSYPRMGLHPLTSSRFSPIALNDSAIPTSARLTATYDVVFFTLFASLRYSHVAVIEDDLLLSRRFADFMRWGSLAMEEVDDLFCVTAWNDDAATAMPTSALTPTRSSSPLSSSPLPLFVTRSSHFQGLGWMTSRAQFVRHLLPLWVDWAPHIQWDYLPFAAVLLSRAQREKGHGGAASSLYEGRGDAVDALNRWLDETPRQSSDVSSHCSAMGRATDLSAERMKESWPSLPSASLFPAPSTRYSTPLSCLSPSIPFSHHRRTGGGVDMPLIEASDPKGVYSQSAFDRMPLWDAPLDPANPPLPPLPFQPRFSLPSPDSFTASRYPLYLLSLARSHSAWTLCVPASSPSSQQWMQLQGEPYRQLSLDWFYQPRQEEEGVVLVLHRGRLLAALGEYGEGLRWRRELGCHEELSRRVYYAKWQLIALLAVLGVGAVGGLAVALLLWKGRGVVGKCWRGWTGRSAQLGTRDREWEQVSLLSAESADRLSPSDKGE